MQVRGNIRLASLHPEVHAIVENYTWTTYWEVAHACRDSRDRDPSRSWRQARQLLKVRTSRQPYSPILSNTDIMSALELKKKLAAVYTNQWRKMQSSLALKIGTRIYIERYRSRNRNHFARGSCMWWWAKNSFSGTSILFSAPVLNSGGLMQVNVRLQDLTSSNRPFNICLSILAFSEMY